MEIIGTLAFIVIAIVVLFIVLFYTVAIQKKAVKNQGSAISDTKKSLEYAQESVHLQKRALERDHEIFVILNDMLETQKAILKELQTRRGGHDG